MHQHPRPAPRSAASANSSQSNPHRSNNQRDTALHRTPSTQDLAADAERHSSGHGSQSARMGDPELRNRLNQVIQHFFSKTALVILSSRVSLTPAYLKNGDLKIDRWFNTFVEDTDALAQDLSGWSTMNCSAERPPPLTIDVYLDTSQLSQNQALVALDEEGKSWDISDVLETLNSAGSLPTTSQASAGIVYERWTISLGDAPSVSPAQLVDHAPNVYKKGVVMMRSLYTYARLLPAWRFIRRLGRHAGNGATLKSRHHILDASLDDSLNMDRLTHPLFPSNRSSTETYQFAPINCLFGSLNVSVQYRTQFDLQVETSERLLSDRIARQQEVLEQSDRSTAVRQTQRGTAIGKAESLPQGRGPSLVSRSSTRHSPLRPSSLAGSYGQTSYDSHEGPAHATAPSRPGMDIASQIKRYEENQAASASRTANAGDEASSHGSRNQQPAGALPGSMPRRTSVSFQPFKAGSLSSSPKGTYLSPSPSTSVGKANSPLLSHARNRSSLSTLPQQALRTPTLPNENAVTSSSASSSPKPAPLQRYSSSFGNRKARFPSSGNSKTEDDNNSSGRGSISSTHRGSSSLAEEGGGSSGSMPTDEDNIADFLKLLDKNKGLQSFSRTDQASMNANSQRTAAQYSEFSRMRDSTPQLTESMSSSLMLHRSSSSSSRQLHNVPGMVAGSSVSTSSSPGKPISPHTPHMPAIPSRLSNNSIVADYSRDRSRSRPSDARVMQSRRDESAIAEDQPASRDSGTPASTTTAIDIPTSPRTFPANRRSSSVAQQARVRPQMDEHEPMPFGLHSASLPNAERPEQSLSELMMQNGSGASSRRRRELSAVVDDDDEPLLFALQAEE